MTKIYRQQLKLYVFIMLSIIISSYSTVFAQENNTNFTQKDNANLLGPVKTVTYFEGESSKILIIHSYRKDGSLESLGIPDKFLISYDTKGRAIKNENIKSYGKDITSFTIYDDLNHKYTSYSFSSIPNERTGTLNDNGDVLESSAYSTNGDYIGKTIHEYSKDRRKSISIRYNGKGKLRDKYETIYDIHGHTLESNHYDVTSNPIQYVIKSKECNKFDSNGRQVETDLYERSSLLLTDITIYSDYDRYGNWTKRTKTKGYSLYPTQLRKIEYFEQ